MYPNYSSSHNNSYNHDNRVFPDSLPAQSQPACASWMLGPNDQSAPMHPTHPFGQQAQYQDDVSCSYQHSPYYSQSSPDADPECSDPLRPANGQPSHDVWRFEDQGAQDYFPPGSFHYDASSFRHLDFPAGYPTENPADRLQHVAPTMTPDLYAHHNSTASLPTSPQDPPLRHDEYLHGPPHHTVVRPYNVTSDNSLVVVSASEALRQYQWAKQRSSGDDPPATMAGDSQTLRMEELPRHSSYAQYLPSHRQAHTHSDSGSGSGSGSGPSSHVHTVAASSSRAADEMLVEPHMIVPSQQSLVHQSLVQQSFMNLAAHRHAQNGIGMFMPMMPMSIPYAQQPDGRPYMDHLPFPDTPHSHSRFQHPSMLPYFPSTTATAVMENNNTPTFAAQQQQQQQQSQPQQLQLQQQHQHQHQRVCEMYAPHHSSTTNDDTDADDLAVACAPTPSWDRRTRTRTRHRSAGGRPSTTTITTAAAAAAATTSNAEPTSPVKHEPLSPSSPTPTPSPSTQRSPHLQRPSAPLPRHRRHHALRPINRRAAAGLRSPSPSPRTTTTTKPTTATTTTTKMSMPTRSSMRRSPGMSKQRQLDNSKKPTLACIFCRGRKIACGPPPPGSTDNTCNQCARRHLVCEYPLESRRGMRKKKAVAEAAAAAAAAADALDNDEDEDDSDSDDDGDGDSDDAC